MASKTPSPWLFVLAGLPYGVVGSFSTLVMGYVMRKAKVEVGTIGIYGTILFIPPMVQFLYAPLVDVGPKRKHWAVIMATISAGCILGACMMPLPEHVPAFLALAAAAQLLTGLLGAANGGLLATVIPDDQRGRAGAAWNIGNVSGGALSASIVIYLVGKEYDPRLIGLVLAAMLVLPPLAMLTVDEPPRERQELGEVFRAMGRDVKNVILTRQGLTGIALCISPVGTAALVNYFPAIAPDYNASPSTIAFVSGIAGAALTAVGALAGGYLCDRYNRRIMYLVSGTLTALCGIAMMLSPRVSDTYFYGAMVYALITGLCYTAFTATALETIGKGGAAASTKYSMFTAAGNVAIAYVGLVDTQFHERHGVEGVVGADAGLNLLGVVILAVVFWRMGAFGRWRHVKEPAIAPARVVDRADE